MIHTTCEIMQYEKHWKDVDNIKTFIDSTIQKHKEIKRYAFIRHDKDFHQEPHWHIFLDFGSLMKTFSTIAKWFKVEEQYVNKLRNRFIYAVLYCDHTLAPNKFQYSLDEVYCNFDYFKLKNKYILKYGDINFDLHSIAYYENFYIRNVKKLREIDYLYNKWLEIRSRDKRNIDKEIIYITGKSGVGKTTYAKYLAYKNFTNEEIYITSSSNDILDGYKGEKCIIIDELRQDNLSFNNLLKFLDNHTSTSVASRYHNKHLWRCEVIIITSIYEPNNVYKNIDEIMIQLLRRIEEKLELIKLNLTNKDLIFLNYYQYDKKINDYILVKKNVDVTKIIQDYIKKISLEFKNKKESIICFD